MYKDILLPIVTHPDTCSVQSIQASIEIASLLDAHLTALTTEPKFPLPLTFRPYAKEVKEGIAEIQKKIGETAARQFAYFEEEARRNGIAHETIMAPCPEMDIRSTILNYALLRNMTILPFIAEDSNWIGLAQSLIFESGHPVLILPTTPRRPFKLDRVVIGWDFTRAASRAIADALPLLQRAGEVQVVIVRNEKPLATGHSGAELAKHLARNNVRVGLEEVDAAGRKIGDVLAGVAKGADLLVMGAYGHSRIRDFILGGATRAMLENPEVPILLSH